MSSVAETYPYTTYNPVLRLDQTIRSQGIPIDGVAGSSAENYRIDFQSSATDEQRVEANRIAQEFDWREYKPRPATEIDAQLETLPSEQLQRLMVELICSCIQQDPNWATERGVDIPGGEPDDRPPEDVGV